MSFTDARKASHTRGQARIIGRYLPPKESCISHGARCLPVGAPQCGTGRRAPKSQGIPTTHRSRTPRRPDHQRCTRRKAQRGFTVPSGLIALSVKGAPHPLARADSSEKSAAVSISPTNVRCTPSALLSSGAPPERQPISPSSFFYSLAKLDKMRPHRDRKPCFRGRGYTCRKRAKITNAIHYINPIFAGLQPIFTGLVRPADLGGFLSPFSPLQNP